MTGTFHILTLANTSEIQTILSRAVRSDIMVDPRYLRLFEEYTGLRAVYFHYTKDGTDILLPFFERPLPDGGSVAQKDLISPWYYGGPIHTYADDTQATAPFKNMLDQLHEYCLANNVVSEFQRLNPLLHNHGFYEGDAGLQCNRKIVSIDLTPNLAHIRSSYEYKARKNLRRAHVSNLRVVRSADSKHIQTFIELYTSSMDHKKTGRFYYFNEVFFDTLFRVFPDEAHLFTVYAGGEVVASSIVLGNGVVLHDYLRAARPSHLALRPNDFVIDAIVEWAKGAGYREYALGGGHSTDGGDDLFRFKKSFSPLTRDFYLYKRVHDKKSYEMRCVANHITEPGYEQAEYFPEYTA